MKNKYVVLKMALPEEWANVISKLASSQVRTVNNVMIIIILKYLKANKLIGKIDNRTLSNIVHSSEVAVAGESNEWHSNIDDSWKPVEEIEDVIDNDDVSEENNKERVKAVETPEEDNMLSAMEKKINAIQEEEGSVKNPNDDSNKKEYTPQVVNVENKGFIDRMDKLQEASSEEKADLLKKFAWTSRTYREALAVYDAYMNNPLKWSKYIADIDSRTITIDDVFNIVENNDEDEDVDIPDETEDDEEFNLNQEDDTEEKEILDKVNNNKEEDDEEENTNEEKNNDSEDENSDDIDAIIAASQKLK